MFTFTKINLILKKKKLCKKEYYEIESEEKLNKLFYYLAIK